MQRPLLPIALALVTLVFSGFTGVAQLLSSSAPIIIQLAEIDRFEASFWPAAKVMEGAELGLPLENVTEAEVEVLVREGVFKHRPIWVMDGNKVLAECYPVGEFISEFGKPDTKYGFMLSFASVEPAEKLYAILSREQLRQERNVNELISIYKSKLDDRTSWR